MLYVSFDDSNTDPTYANADSVYLVDAPSSEDGNPCVSDNARTIPLFPSNKADLQTFAEFFGWEVREENGKMVIVTDVR